MSRSIASRFSALLLALTFVSGRAGGEAAHACPIHDAIALQQPHAPQVASTGHHHAEAASQPASEGHEHGAGCTCMGSCTVGGLSVQAPAATTLAFTAYFSTPAPAVLSVRTLLPGRPDFQQPLASGPPDVLRSA